MLDENSNNNERSPREILIYLLEEENELISDARWIELLRMAHENKSKINIPGHHWILLISGRDPQKLKSILKYGRLPNT
jgi:hypothetical protein